MARPRALLTRFSRDAGGASAMMFALSTIPVAVAVGLAVDSSRAANAELAVQSAVDSATLAVARAQWGGKATPARLESLAQATFDANMETLGVDAACDPVDMKRNAAAGGARVTATCTLETTIGALAGVDAMTVQASSAATYEDIDIEIALMLDATGSMKGDKNKDLRDAATLLVDTLFAESSFADNVRIALAPYAKSVNVGSAHYEAITGVKASDLGAGDRACVTERTGADAFTDTAPSLSAKTRLNTKTTDCPSAEILPLTANAETLRKEIEALPASGMTAGHLGTAFARYLLSPDWADVWGESAKPANYGQRRTLKAAVLMTDGKYNQRFENSLGDSREQALKHCAAMKAQGVTVYAVAFKAPSDAETLLKTCSSGEGYFFKTSTGDELKRAYSAIAQNLMGLRLTQ